MHTRARRVRRVAWDSIDEPIDPRPGPSVVALDRLQGIECRRVIDAILAKMRPGMAKALRLKFGLHDGYTYTGEEIGRLLWRSRESTHAMIYCTLARLRGRRFARRLRSFARDMEF